MEANSTAVDENEENVMTIADVSKFLMLSNLYGLTFIIKISM